jgi:hypothetical protein
MDDGSGAVPLNVEVHQYNMCLKLLQNPWRKRTRSGSRRARLWQLLNPDTGIPRLDRQLTAGITIMPLSENKRQFEENRDKLFGKQPRLPFGVPKELASSSQSPDDPDSGLADVLIADVFIEH